MKSLYERLLDTEDSLIAGMDGDLHTARVIRWAEAGGLKREDSIKSFSWEDTYCISNNKVQIGTWSTYEDKNTHRTIDELLPSNIKFESINRLNIVDTSCEDSNGTIRINTQKDIDRLSKIYIKELILQYNCDISKLNFSKLHVDDFCLYSEHNTSIRSLPNANTIRLITLKKDVQFDLQRIKGVKTNFLKIDDVFSINGVQICEEMYGTKVINGDDVTRELGKLRTLDGGPEHVGEDYDCAFCRNLESLEGVPEWIGGNFSCRECRKIKTLVGGPKIVEGKFDCSIISGLKNLVGAPKQVGRDFKCCECRNLKSLEGMSKHIGGTLIDLDDCKNLKSLEGIPKNTNARISVVNCPKLKDYAGIPEDKLSFELIPPKD